jgi:hypothetical protein
MQGPILRGSRHAPYRKLGGVTDVPHAAIKDGCTVIATTAWRSQ